MDTTDNLKMLEKEEILQVLKKFIVEVIGKSFASEIDNIDASSSFANDVEFDSIELVEFSEKIKTHYGSKIDFHDWLSGMDLEQIFRMTVGDVINYIEGCLSKE